MVPNVLLAVVLLPLAAALGTAQHAAGQAASQQQALAALPEDLYLNYCAGDPRCSEAKADFLKR